MSQVNHNICQSKEGIIEQDIQKNFSQHTREINMEEVYKITFNSKTYNKHDKPIKIIL